MLTHLLTPTQKLIVYKVAVHQNNEEEDFEEESMSPTGLLWEAKPAMWPGSSNSSVKSSKLFELVRRYWSPLSTFASIVVSAVPYILFLLVYGANELIRVLPTSKSGQSPCVRLQNVSAWESVFLPFSVNRAIASVKLTPLDFLSAVPYLAHYILPIVYPLALVVLAGRVDCAQRFYRLVGWTMWVHYAIWYILPTAPPWFYDAQQLSTTKIASPTLAAIVAAATGGTGKSAVVPSLSAMSTSQLIVPEHREGAAFARIDQLTGVGFFYGLFHGNPVPFAAFPSGHVAWPTCVLLTLPSTVRRLPFVLYVCVVAWATMYSSHHYLSDVLAALVVVLVVDRVLQRMSNRIGGLQRLTLPIVYRPSKVAKVTNGHIHTNGHAHTNGYLDV